MSVIAITKHYHAEQSKLLRAIVIASKNNSARCMEAALSYLIHAPTVAASTSLCACIRRKLDGEKKSDPVFLESLHLFSGNINRLVASKDKLPREIVKEVLSEFTAFKNHHNLPYVDIKRTLDDLLLSLTINAASRQPEKAKAIIDDSIEIYHESLGKKNVHGIPVRRSQASNGLQNEKFHKLKGLFEFAENNGPSKRVNFGRSEVFPLSAIARFKDNLAKLFKHENAFESAINVIDFTNSYNAYPTGKSGMVYSKGVSKLLSKKEVLTKLSEIYRTQGADAYRGQVAHLTPEIRLNDLFLLIRSVKRHPEQIELFKMDGFAEEYDRAVDSIYAGGIFKSKINSYDEMRRLLQEYYTKRPRQLVFGPDFPFYPASGEALFVSSGELDIIKNQVTTIREYVMLHFPEIGRDELDTLWKVASGNAEGNSIVSNGRVIEYPVNPTNQPRRSL